MKNKITILVLLFAIAIPQVVSATWWNPFSWKIFERVFTPKIEMVKPPVSEENISTTIEESEVEKLHAEVEELKKQKTPTPTTQTPTKQKTSIVTPTPALQTTTKTMSKDEVFADIMQKYMAFQSTITKEKSGINVNFPLPSEKQYFIYLDDLLVKIKADLGYLVSIKEWNSRPASIEEIYLSKFNKLKGEYDVEAKRYVVEREQDRSNSITAQEQAKKEASAQAILDQHKYVQDIKVKIAEINQLLVQIDTMSWFSLVDKLNNAKKLDGTPVFYTLTYYYGAGQQDVLEYPYSLKRCNYNLDNCSRELKRALENVISNYISFLSVELAKNQ